MLDIERKFLVKDNTYKKDIINEHEIEHGYIGLPDKSAARITIIDNKAYIVLKTIGLLSREEYKVEIPIKDARNLLKTMCTRIIYKTRYNVIVGNTSWDVDEYHGNDNGLVIAEVDLNNTTDDYDKPEWLGEEVTNNSYYYCSTIAYKPYKDKLKSETADKAYENWRDNICK